MLVLISCRLCFIFRAGVLIFQYSRENELNDMQARLEREIQARDNELQSRDTEILRLKDQINTSTREFQVCLDFKEIVIVHFWLTSSHF